MPVKFTEIPRTSSPIVDIYGFRNMTSFLDDFDDVHVLVVGVTTLFLGFLMVRFSVGYVRD